METRIASCHCRDVELKADGSPVKISMCHCLDCQRRTGSAFSVAVFALGAFADPKFSPPTQSVWTRDKHDWLDVPDGMTEFDLNPQR
jgi:hypothetical protein